MNFCCVFYLFGILVVNGENRSTSTHMIITQIAENAIWGTWKMCIGIQANWGLQHLPNFTLVVLQDFDWLNF